MRLKLIAVLSWSLFIVSCSNQTIEQHHHEPATRNADAAQTTAGKPEAEEHSHDVNDPHMRMTALRQPNAEDARRREIIAERARKGIERYKDYKAALGDGFEILLPEVPQKMYHFNKLENYLEAESRFNPERPTSLLYEKTADGYRLIGVMYTAPAGMSENDLHERVPLSVTQWHEHVYICLPRGTNMFNGLIGQGDKFGLTGSIDEREECEASGGQFLPRLLGWMVHLYPFEPTV
jgi:hypothetical protein